MKEEDVDGVVGDENDDADDGGVVGVDDVVSWFLPVVEIVPMLFLMLLLLPLHLIFDSKCLTTS